MILRRATRQDLPGIDELLSQVLDVHHAGRPDLFKANARKYTDDELLQILADDERPIFVAVEPDAMPGEILGYAFCMHQHHPNDNILTDVHTLYIDDLCVDEAARGKHVGTKLYEYVLDYARSRGFYNVTLNVWACNESAHRFYEHLGLTPQKYGMEQIL
ncbi:MAG: GNAT family N-acetyltransferase [Atopobiaceae bacterium]|nr:GNAT family N-acetyltransferase [Atopobiaceae bacterium]MBR3313362.1 GNAT family N-acetyltransferase [Atopobiaceae bacterium]